ncbi:DUF2569 family protein [Bisbaumannia pacifica]|uniref:Zinc ribbon domain-containing protein n=1 Tax=Bisbaumannia pacifica TaxID=77098 RepID=A0ABD4KZM7_9GAMM|nr:DUF2569 family protein [Halomonas pacifica]MBH8578763.1 zinc ribbon domain-containing protein [Halomonas pacifica]
MFCTNCGTEAANKGARYCFSCGSELHRKSGPSIPVAALQDERAQTSANRKEPKGIGGWLLVLIIVLVALYPLMNVGGVIAGIKIMEMMEPSLADYYAWGHYRTTMLATTLAISAASIYTGYWLITKRSKKSIETISEIIWVIGIGAAIVTNVLIPLFFRDQLFMWAGPTGGALIGSLLGSLLFSWVWSTYLSKSIRVRNTYTD